MAEEPPVFTIARVAELLGQDRKTVREHFDEATLDAGHFVKVRGQRAQAWPINVLPSPVRLRLESLARTQGFEDVTRFAQCARTRWHPNVPYGKVANAYVDRAERRCKVLAPVIRAHRNEPISAIVAAAVRAWNDAPNSTPACERTIRRWIERAIERDSGFEDWSRSVIYLDDDAPAAPVQAWGSFVDAPLIEDGIQSMTTAAAPTQQDLQFLWMRAMDQADVFTREGRDARKIQDVIVSALWQTGFSLAKNREALRVAYRRRRERWLEDGRPGCLADGRKQENIARRWALPESDRIVLLRYYWNCGDLASAFRLAQKNNALSAETAARFVSAPSDKSRMPHSIRVALKTDMILLDQRRVGPSAAKLAGGWIERDHSGYAPGDWWQGDDLTPPVYFWDESQAPFFFGRGQIVMMIDIRSMYVLGWCLASARNYNAREIRSLITRCHDEHGLPRNGFYFERGIWQKSRILKGRVDESLVDHKDTEQGLREFGLHFEHATTPRAKVIERIFGLLQNRMEGTRGYCGRDERRDCPEHVRRQILDVTAGRVHPSAYFLHKSEWAAEIDRIVADYNAERHSMRARVIPGKTPAEVYGARQTDDIVWLPPESRYLLAAHRVKLTAGRNGIRLPPGGLGGALYRGENSGDLIGREVLAWVDPDDLSTITVTDLDRQNPRIIERADAIGAFANDPRDIHGAVQNLSAHNQHGANLYHIVGGVGKGKGFRRVITDQKTIAVGAEMARQASARAEQNRAAATDRRFVQAAAATDGLPIRAGDTSAQLARQRQGAELRRAAIAAIEKQRAAAPAPEKL